MNALFTASTDSSRANHYTGLTQMAHDMITPTDNIPQFQGLRQREFDHNVIHFTPIVIRPRPDPVHINPITNFISRHTGSPANGGLNFDFFSSPSRTVEDHSSSMNEARGSPNQ